MVLWWYRFDQEFFFALNLVIYMDPIKRNCTEVNSLSELRLARARSARGW